MALLLLIGGCATPDAASEGRRALEALDETAAAVAGDLQVVQRGGPTEIEYCAWLPGMPTSRRAIEVWREYALPPDEPGALRIDAMVEHWEARGAQAVYRHDRGVRGVTTRLSASGRHLFGSAEGGTLRLRAISGCYQP